MTDEYYMKLALKEAEKAYLQGEIPVGALIVQNDQIIAKGYNQTELLKDSTAHAEIIALTAAFNTLNSKYLPEATLYVTLEPCLMCCGALYWSKISRVVYAASDDKNGYTRIENCCNDATKPTKLLHPKTSLSNGVLAEESLSLLKNFFKERRMKSFQCALKT